MPSCWIEVQKWLDVIMRASAYVRISDTEKVEASRLPNGACEITADLVYTGSPDDCKLWLKDAKGSYATEVGDSWF